ncbi:MOSC N-terminal beta barrel domain-containing protein [Allorhizocola rhizosphaerae]|uniref:MOSC N-terminal beta barrel domain-containing protein n=1 Tax=Allorhizocola rhizosphaerae TaxID=1872709 RepID=UPI000E3EC929|nr:MOSC N-terminal beta barrel domain-containing protein [Allorhizocola rhizosphaerae]
MNVTGTVVALQRYPVKSMLGERLDSAEVTANGIAGDRTHALLDVETGKIASAKQPRLWRDLLTMSYAEADEEVLSRRLGRRVRLVKEAPDGTYLDRARPDEVLEQGVDAVVGVDRSGLAPGTFFDFAALHIITTASLKLVGRSDFERYRPNVVVETDELEYDWVGRSIHIGQATVRVIVPTPRCAVPTLAHGAWPADTDALRVPSRINRHEIPGQGMLPCVGVYASVERAGRIALGNEVRA